MLSLVEFIYEKDINPFTPKSVKAQHWDKEKQTVPHESTAQ